MLPGLILGSFLFFLILSSRPGFLKSGQLITGQTGLIYKGKDGTGRIIKPDEYALKSEVEGVVGDMNNELVKYGKEKISEAITEKGVPTSTSDSFDQMAANIGAIKSEYNNGDLNIFCQTTKPSAQNGLWIKRNPSEINNILIKDDYYLEDGIGIDLPITFTRIDYANGHTAVAGVVYNNKLYIFLGSNSSNGSAILQIINLTDYSVVVRSMSTALMSINDNGTAKTDKYVYFITSSNNYLTFFSLSALDSITSGGSVPNAGTVRIYSGITAISNNIKPYANCIIDNILYTIAVYNNESFYVCKNTINDSNGYTNFIEEYHFTPKFTIPGWYENCYKAIYYGGLLYCFVNMILLFTYNISTHEFIEYNKAVAPANYNGSQKIGGIAYKLGKVFFMGTSSTNLTTDPLTDICTYDIASGKTGIMKNIFSETTDRFGDTSHHSIQDGDHFYFLHNYIKSSTTYNQIVTQFSFGSNTYETGTILCLPSATSNLTKMYSSGLITLNYGIDDVYYQAADGLHKQDAAIIKDGVVTNI